MLDEDKLQAFAEDVEGEIKALACRSAERRARVTCDTVMATVWTVKAMLDGKPHTVCESSEVREALDAMLDATARLNEAMQKVAKAVKEGSE